MEFIGLFRRNYLISGFPLMVLLKQLRTIRWGVVIRLLPILFVAGILVYSSSQTYEQQSIVPLLNRILAREFFIDYLLWIDFTYAGTQVSIEVLDYDGFAEFLIRKSAHLILFFLISLFFCIFVNYLSNHLGLTVVLTFIFVVAFAVLDEFHQYLTGGRTPLVQDVILDMVGGLLAMVFYVMWRFARK